MNKRLAHIVFQTNQVREMRDFYMTLLEAQVVFENDSMCFITYDDEHHRLAFMSVPGGSTPRPANSVGLMHSAFTFSDLESLLANHQRLLSLGIEPVAPIQHGPTTSIYYRDPDRCLVELQIDNFHSAGEATAFMQSAEYSEDPLVSSDVVGELHSAVFDGLATMVLDDMVKMVVWYDNGWAYAERVVELLERSAAEVAA